MHPSSHLYVIGPAAGPFKVGIAHDPQRRLTTLQAGSPARLLLHLALPAPRPVAAAAERVAHQALATQRLHGEWFSATLVSVKGVVADALAAAQCPRQREAGAIRVRPDRAETCPLTLLRCMVAAAVEPRDIGALPGFGATAERGGVRFTYRDASLKVIWGRRRWLTTDRWREALAA